MKKTISVKLLIAFYALFCGCNSRQNSAIGVVQTYAQSIVNIDLHGAISCIENGEEVLSYVAEAAGTSMSDMEDMVQMIRSACANGLGPQMSYEIVSQNINGDYGTVSVAFTIEMGYGERAGSHTYTENIPVYRYGGVWWIGEGHTEDIMELWSRIKNITEFYGSF